MDAGNKARSDRTDKLLVQVLTGFFGFWIVVLFVALAALAGWFYAFVASVLWKWFVADTFGGPAPSVAQMYGLLLLTGFILERGRFDRLVADKTKTTTDRAKAVLYRLFFKSLAAPLLVLLIGWVVKAWLV